MKEISNSFIESQFHAREYEIEHPTYDDELAFYDLIKNGNVNELKKRNLRNADEEKRGILSKDKVRNLRYHLIVSLAMITRFCIEGGMPEQDAYTLSDTYINQLDIANEIDMLYTIQRAFIFDFANQMQQLQRKRNFSMHITLALDYIYNHLLEPITVEEIASQIGISPTYLSRLFYKETGQTLSAYIRKKRIQSAQNMLVYSNYSCAEIAQYLSFSSSSYFSAVFKEETGTTPLKYRRQNYRRHWHVNDGSDFVPDSEGNLTKKKE